MSTFRITLSGSGFAVRKGELLLTQMEWDEIKEIIAYKQDLFTYDNVCFGFRPTDKDEHFIVDEEVAGFYELEHALVKNLKSFDRSWREKVIEPAFALNLHTIYILPSESDG